MSYLKIYPKRIVATLNTGGSYGGVISFLIEQYGLQANDEECDVKIIQKGDQWQIWLHPISDVQKPQLKRFDESLNDYLFSVLKLQLTSLNVGLSKLEVFFDDIYFEISGQDAVVREILSKN